jgi:hypothetical protein
MFGKAKTLGEMLAMLNAQEQVTPEDWEKLERVIRGLLDSIDWSSYDCEAQEHVAPEVWEKLDRLLDSIDWSSFD